MIITFGKYRGSTISEIMFLYDDAAYVLWLYEKNFSKELAKESKRQLAIFTKEIILHLRTNKVMDFNNFNSNARFIIKKMFKDNFELYGKEKFKIITRNYFKYFSSILPKEVSTVFLSNPDCHNVVYLTPIVYSRQTFVEKYTTDADTDFLPF